MAGGCNKRFRNRPRRFLRSSEIRFSLIRPVLDGRQLVDLEDTGWAQSGRNINIIPWQNRPGHPVANLNPGRFFPGPAPVVAYCLHARQDRPDATNRAIPPANPLPALPPLQGMIDLGANADFFLTDEMSGCMLSIYGPSIVTAPRVEHMNYQGPNQQATYNARYGMIRAAFPNARILARTGTCLPAGMPGVTYYDNHTWVVGVRLGGQWDFWYHVRGSAAVYRLESP